MKVLFIVTRADNIGGSHIHVRDLAKKLTEEGHQVCIAMGGPGPVVNHYQSFGLEPIIIPELDREISLMKDFRAYRGLKKVMNDYKPDLVSTHSSKAGFLGRLAAKATGIPVLFTAHGWSFTSGKSWLSRKAFLQLEKIVAPISKKIITVSDYDRKLALSNLNSSPDDIVTIHNGMPDIDRERIEKTRSDEINIVMVARFDNQKNHIELLDAVHKLNGYHIHFIGDGPLQDKVQKHAEALSIDSKITFWGRLDSVAEVLEKSDIFALISNWEGFPRSTLEAMRAGLPVIVSNVGGAGEAVEHGVTGYIVEKGDVNSLENYINTLLLSEVKRKEMGLKGRQRFETFFEFEIMYQKTLSIYKEILC